MKKMPGPAGVFLIAAVSLFLFSCVYFQVSPDRLTGAAFCHQIPARSPAFGFPFCYRCSGLFFGIFFGLSASCLTGRSDKLFSRSLLTAYVVSILLFLLDILNSSKFPLFHVYTEKVSYRFLSAYPLGYCTAQLIASIIKYILVPIPSRSAGNRITELILFFLSAELSYSAIFFENYAVSLISRIILAAAAITFISCLYAILFKCFSLWRNKADNSVYPLITGLACALLQISFIGFLHLRFLPFEQFL